MNKALIVDDEEDVRELLKCLFDAGGYEVCEAGNGLEAMKKALVFRPDIVVTDICMPIMGGWEFIKNLRENELTCHIPVIMVTGRPSERDVFHTEKPSNCRFMTKPFELDAIMKMSRRMLSKRDCCVAVDVSVREVSSVD
ncbi:MAG TPA: response regulator [bacterium]|nr:response regulator [bacterium]